MKRLWLILSLSFILVAQSNNFFKIPVIDLNHRKDLQAIVDKESGVYLGHPTTVLLEDGKTILTVYPKGHGAGEIIYKRSLDQPARKFQPSIVLWMRTVKSGLFYGQGFIQPV